jgi:hypothetical protein
MDENERSRRNQEEAARQAQADLANHAQFCPNCSGLSPGGGYCTACRHSMNEHEQPAYQELSRERYCPSCSGPSPTGGYCAGCLHLLAEQPVRAGASTDAGGGESPDSFRTCSGDLRQDERLAVAIARCFEDASELGELWTQACERAETYALARENFWELINSAIADDPDFARELLHAAGCDLGGGTAATAATLAPGPQAQPIDNVRRCPNCSGPSLTGGYCASCLYLLGERPSTSEGSSSSSAEAGRAHRDCEQFEFRGRRDAMDVPAIQVGHRISHHTGAPSYFAIEDADFNQQTGRGPERGGGYTDKRSVLIQGVWVDYESALRWSGPEAREVTKLSRELVEEAAKAGGPGCPAALGLTDESARKRFAQEALGLIAAVPDHPLRFLIDGGD